MRGYRFVVLTLLLCMWSVQAHAQDETFSLPEVVRELEDARHAKLAQIQATGEPQDFTSDGCSGGLSDAWQFLARHLPVFADKFDPKPPYEACCVEHDRAYWRGETLQGFDKRLQADAALQECVNNFGKVHSGEFAQRFGLSQAAIERNFAITAALMYRAVRAGGAPCSGLPWRWGYGWPECADASHAE